MYIGIDPDLHDLAIGYWDHGPVRAEVIHVPRRKGRVAQTAVVDMVLAAHSGLLPLLQGPLNGVAVEAQTLRRQGLKQHKRPEDIVTLGNVAGAVLAMALRADYGVVHFPTPEEWKGQIPKHVMQARLYSELGWGYEIVGKDKNDQGGSYSRPLKTPSAFNHISAGQWKHVGDALLLARWASENIS